MRIAVVGDLQYQKGENISLVADDIAKLNADTVILLGDYGYWDGFGTYEVFKEVYDEFSRIGCKSLVPVIGNHDVQNEAGERLIKSGTLAENYTRAFGMSPENQILEFESFRIFCLHTEVQKKGDFYFEYECYISDETLECVKKELERYPQKPVIMITHAPPAGCGLITVPMVHVRAANAYLNQDHGYEKWAKLVRDYRQIVMWFSGHYHMGHYHEDSSVVTDGVVYFTTGSPTSGTRDNQRHTRIIDVIENQIKVSTFDHDTKIISEKPDYVFCLNNQREEKKKKEITGVFSAGCGRVKEGGLKTGANGRLYAMTDNNILWEIDIVDKIALGAIHYSDKYKLDEFETDESYIWRFCGEYAFGHRYTDKNRFMREKDWENCVFVTKNKSDIKRKKSRSISYKNRVACETDNGHICSAFNDENGKLWFEISPKD